MISKKLTTVLLTLCGVTTALFALDADKSKEEKGTKVRPKEELFSAEYNQKLSQMYGHLIYKSLDNPVVKLNTEFVIQGIQDARLGKNAPMTEKEYEEAINSMQEFAFQETAQKNLEEAERFLKENAKKKGIVTVEPGKVQYIVLEKGKDSSLTVNDSVTVKMHYTGKYANDTVFGSSEESGGPISISIDQTIPGFRKGMQGMKTGEKRRIFIHPDLGYGTSGQLLPNALLVFDIEVIDIKPKPEGEATEEQATAEDLPFTEDAQEDDLVEDLEEELDLEEDSEENSTQDTEKSNAA